LSATVPSTVVPSRKVTVPVGVGEVDDTVAVKVTEPFIICAPAVCERTVVVGSLPTTCDSGAEAAVELAVSPPYVAVMVWVPIVKVEVDRIAIPPLTVPVPRTVEPSRKVIVPVAAEGTVAVKVTAWFSAAGLAEELSVTVGAPIATVTVVAGDVAALLVAVAATEAVMGLEPIGRLGTVIVATPLTTVAVPSTVEPLEKVTGPVTPDGTVSVIVTGVLGEGLEFETDGGGRTGVVLSTVTVVAGEVAALLVEVSATEAVIGLEPMGRLGTVMVAVPLTTGAVPIGVVPLEKVTGPVTPGGTVSVIVTGVFGSGLGLETDGGGSTGVVLVIVITVTGEVAGLLFASPGVVAVIGLEPTGRFGTVMVAVPLMIGAVPMGSGPL
jgi:hypothetical protein